MPAFADWVEFVLLIAIALLGSYTLAMVAMNARTGNVLASFGLALPIFRPFGTGVTPGSPAT